MIGSAAGTPLPADLCYSLRSSQQEEIPLVRIRLTRMGSKKRPFYRIVVANSTSPREGRAIDQIGYYDPLTDPATIKIDAQKAGDWLRKGAQPTESVSQLFRRSGLQEQIDAARTGAAAPAATATAE